MPALEALAHSGFDADKYAPVPDRAALAQLARLSNGLLNRRQITPIRKRVVEFRTAGATGASAAGGATPAPTRVPASVSEDDPAITASAVQLFTGVGGVIGRPDPHIELMAIEPLFYAANPALVTYARARVKNAGHVFASLVITVAAALMTFAAHLAWQIHRLDIDDPALCLMLFKSNRDAGLILFAGFVLEALVRRLV